MRKIFILFSLVVAAWFSNAIETKNSKYVGMPVGGICAGQVYLGGDGQLWYWDIFNVAVINPGNEGGHRFYINPQAQDKRFENGFALTIKQGDRKFFRALNKKGFSDIQFQGEYPMGKVSFNDPALPVSASLQAYSPFIPTDANNSGLPITILEYTVTNTSNKDLEVEITGWLQNMSCFLTGKEKAGKHINKTETDKGITRLVCEGPGELKEELADWGSMSLTLLDEGVASAKAGKLNGLPMYFGDNKSKEAEAKLGEELVGSVSGNVKLASGESKTFTYHISWYFPNIHLWNGAHHWKGIKNLRHFYTTNFDHASAVSNYVAENNWLVDATKSWNKTWYASTLPKWFLDRTFVNVATMATTASVRFNDLTDDPDNEGRYYNFEGVYLGHGTCTHVFHYEQAMGRVFPNLTRQLREQIDLGLSYKDDGVIAYRGEMSDMGRHDGRGYAVDGHAGTIMRIYREHTMAPDNSFLKNNWSKIRQSIQYMIDQDKEKTGKADGILEGIQYNTLDRMWYGKITWISGLYAAALKAGAKMAAEVGDRNFAKTCSKIADLAFKNISEELFNGEYFIQKLDPDHLDAPNSNIGCHTDQLLGQYWSTQMGLGDILPNNKVKSALKSIMKYNYVDNYGDYLENAVIPIKRWYADDDEQGIIMCTFPKGGADKAPGKINSDWEKLVVGYFSEVWTGQEHQLAATLIAEGMVDEALKVEKAVHKRYDADRRNPYNEIEYGNHYTRAMSGYAPFVAASGFTFNGSGKTIGFNPKMKPENFRSAFITAEGWGAFSQKLDNNTQTCAVKVNYGKLNIQEINLKSLLNDEAKSVAIKLDRKPIKSKLKVEGSRVKVVFDPISLSKDQNLEITIK